jgi:hypothetical protein
LQKTSSSFAENFFLIPVTYGTPSLGERAHVPRVGGAQHPRKERLMKFFTSALLALSVLAGIAASASAFDPWKDDAGLRSPL